MRRVVEDVTETVTVTEQSKQLLVVHLHKPKTEKQVKWDEKVIDNEFLGRKSSKCCCIYSAPKVFGESSSESEDSDDGCHELKSARSKKKKQSKKQSCNQGCKCDH
jgi:protein phosphatase 1 regulatory subunit 11